MRRQLVLFLVHWVLSIGVLAQQLTEISGRVLDAASQQPVEFATVLIANTESDVPLTGTTTSADGRFSFTTEATNFYIQIGFIGFLELRIDEFELIDGKISLGDITLHQDTEQLDELVVTGERSQTEFQLDRRVFNVGQDLASTGASALDVLNNVPSVNVSIEGEVTLRGSAGVQILINGKPSILATEEGNSLGTITADMIEKVEVITNPSAKYDAEGTSGIINIVIKKEDRKGTNGSVSVNVGTPANNSIGLSINRRTERFNLFSQLGVGYRVRPYDLTTISTNLSSDTTVLTDGVQFRNERYYNAVLGADFLLNELNTITVSGNYVLELENQPSETNFDLINATNALASEWRRTERTTAVNPKYQFEANYAKDFADNEDHQLIISAQGSFFGKDQRSDFEDETILGSENFDADQKTRTDFREGLYTFKIDYTDPLNDYWTFETGAQYIINDVSNDYQVSDLVHSRSKSDGCFYV